MAGVPGAAQGRAELAGVVAGQTRNAAHRSLRRHAGRIRDAEQVVKELLAGYLDPSV